MQPVNRGQSEIIYDFSKKKPPGMCNWRLPENTVPEGMKRCKKQVVTAAILSVSRLFDQKKCFDYQKQEA
jgi:hypothetical protein